MPPTPTTTRRDFLSAGLAGGAILALPPSLYRRAFAAVPPSETVRLGFVGVGLQGTANLKALLKQPAASVAGLCDVDSKHLTAASALAPKAATHADYRRLLDDKTLDAVVVTTPDHWHALATTAACAAGKDVYCEKPLSLTIDDGKAMVAAARKYNRVVQTGTQQRSSAEFRRACELVRGGAIGKVTSVKVGLPAPNFAGPAVPNSDAPANLDYERWLGPAPLKPYNAKHVHYLFRFFWDYSGGQQTNFGAHHLDIAQWGLDRDESGPTAVTAKARYHKDGWYEVPEWTEVTYTYADGVVMTCGQGLPGGTTFVGEKGTIFVTRGKLTADPAEVLKAEVAVKLPVSTSHHGNWLDCVKSRGRPVADVAIGHRSATVCHLGNLAVRTGRKITWDPVAETVVGDAEAAAMMSRPYRSPWKLES